MHKVIMPKLGMTMESGLIVNWLKKEGEHVKKGEPLLDVMTNKVTIEAESFNTGYLKKILAREGEGIPVTEVIAYIGGKDEEVSEEIIKERVKEKKEEKVLIEEKPKYKEEEKIVKVRAKKILASPLAKRLAKEMAVDLSKIFGTGPGGRIIKADVLKVAKEAKLKKKEKLEIEKEIEEKVVTPEILEKIPLTGLRKTIAERMSKSVREIPQFTLFIEVDISSLESFKDRINKKIKGKKISYTDLIIKATAISLEKYKILNSTLKNEKIIIFKDINIGLAVSIEEGLIVPIIFNSNKLSLEEIADRRIDLVNLARENKLKLKDVTGSTFTITNLGMYEIDYFYPIINPPEAGILAVGSIVKKPAIDKEGEITVKPMLKLGLALDHRILDGAVGAKFIQYLRNTIQESNK